MTLEERESRRLDAAGGAPLGSKVVRSNGESGNTATDVGQAGRGPFAQASRTGTPVCPVVGLGGRCRRDERPFRRSALHAGLARTPERWALVPCNTIRLHWRRARRFIRRRHRALKLNPTDCRAAAPSLCWAPEGLAEAAVGGAIGTMVACAPRSTRDGVVSSRPRADLLDWDAGPEFASDEFRVDFSFFFGKVGEGGYPPVSVICGGAVLNDQRVFALRQSSLETQ